MSETRLQSYYKQGEASFKKWGVHHLSKSSGESLLDCCHKFRFRSNYRTVSSAMSAGTVVHALLEELVETLKEPGVKYLNKEITLEELEKAYELFKEVVISQVDIPVKLMQLCDDEYKSAVNSNVEVLFKEGFKGYRAELYRIIEGMAKSISPAILSRILNCPPLASETAVVYSPEGLEIPYTGFVDLLVIRDGKPTIFDLKTTFSNNQFVWKSKMTQFQLWLYASAIKQMQKLDELPDAGIIRVIIDIGAKKKIQPTVFDVTVEEKMLPSMENLTPHMLRLMKNFEKMIKHGIEIEANSQFGCEYCGYVDKCSYRHIPEWDGGKK